MTIYEALRDYVLDDSTVAGLISDRMSPEPMSEGAESPYVTYQRISNPRTYTHAGQVTLVRPRFQINAWAVTRLGAVAVMDAIRIRLSGYRGTWGDFQILGVICDGGEVDLIEPSPDQDSSRRYGIAQDFLIHHNETAAAFSA